MKTAFIVGSMTLGLMLLTFAGMPSQKAVADNSEPSGVIQTLENGQLETLFAQGNQGGSDNPDANSAYMELRRIIKEFNNAPTSDRKAELEQRATHLLETLFDAKVQREQKRIDVLERRLKDERNRLREMQSHKASMVHKGLQKLEASNGQEMPDWATPASQQR